MLNSMWQRSVLLEHLLRMFVPTFCYITSVCAHVITVHVFTLCSLPALFHLSGKLKNTWQHKLFFLLENFLFPLSCGKWVHAGRRHAPLLATEGPAVGMIPMGAAGLMAAATSPMWGRGTGTESTNWDWRVWHIIILFVAMDTRV